MKRIIPQKGKKIQTKVLSVFECIMEDYNQKLLEIEKINEETE
jgi:hypothetical protein